MRKTLVALLVLVAIMVGAGAAGTPVNGDPSVTATTAGINLGHGPHAGPRVQASPSATVGAAGLVRVLVVLAAATLAVAVVPLDVPASSLVWRERRVTRGPPASRIA